MPSVWRLCERGMSLPDPVLSEHDGFLVVRDDLLPGGTKRRAVHVLFDDRAEYVYASPAYGFAQVALAYAARDHGKRATIFVAKRKEMHPLTREACEAGAHIFEVPHGYMTVVKARAREHAHYFSAKLLPFGLDDARFTLALAEVARKLPITPTEVWTVVGSGTLSRALQHAWPDAYFYGVRVGAEPDAGRAEVINAPEKYEQGAKYPPPFPSCTNYDAKVWQFMKERARPGALFWNVGR